MGERRSEDTAPYLRKEEVRSSARHGAMAAGKFNGMARCLKLLQDSPFAPLELFNLRADPKETENLPAKEKKVFMELSAALRVHIQRGGQVPWQPPRP